MLQFILKETNLSKEVHGTIQQFLRFITKRVPEEKSLLSKLYMVSDENLAKVGIEDHNVVAQMTKKFIHFHLAILHTNAFIATLNQTMDGMRENFSQLTEMGLVSLFLEDGSIITAEQIATKIEEKEKDPISFLSFIQPPIAIDIDGVIHLVTQLLFHCELGDSLPKVFPYKEMLDLGGVHENLCNVLRLSKDDWLPL